MCLVCFLCHAGTVTTLTPSHCCFEITEANRRRRVRACNNDATGAAPSSILITEQMVSSAPCRLFSVVELSILEVS